MVEEIVTVGPIEMIVGFRVFGVAGCVTSIVGMVVWM